jgi:sigma-B regulation protein RsbU (phosphoserine phosphatase)
VTEEARAAFQEALRDDDPEGLYDRAPCGYLSTTPDGTIVKVNGTFLILTGYAREDLVGKRTFASLLTAGGRIYHETHYAPMLRMQERVREIAFEVVTADGGRLPVLVNAALERDPQGEPVVVRTAVFDATERREYERELLRAKQRAEESEARATALARTLQQTLIPPMPPDIPGLDVAAAYRPAGDGQEVGGDFYDVFEVGPDDWVVAIGDVCGKGVDAAVVTALVRYTIRAAAVRLAKPGETLAVVNDVLLHHRTERFCTVMLLRLCREDGGWTAHIGSGGHPLPLLARADGPVEPAGLPGSLLGVVEGADVPDAELALRPGDALVLYTDGVTEARRDGEFYGEARLVARIGANAGSDARSAEALTDAILADVLEFQRGDARDDIAVVAVRVPDDPTG